MGRNIFDVVGVVGQIVHLVNEVESFAQKEIGLFVDIDGGRAVALSDDRGSGALLFATYAVQGNENSCCDEQLVFHGGVF